jgi:hypothetical protein
MKKKIFQRMKRLKKKEAIRGEIEKKIVEIG